ncbi:MAG: hypothetical protein R2911_12810 [Caldilineaceae bacterium]
MSILRENIVYTILALVAIVLIGVTIGLQLVIITGQNPTVLTGAAQQATQQSANANGQQVAFAVATVTATPAVLIIQPAPIGQTQDNPTAPVQNNPVQNNPVQNNPVQNNPVQDNPAQEAPSDEAQAAPTEPAAVEPTATEPPQTAAEQAPVDTPVVAPTESPTSVPPTPLPPTPAPPTPVPPTATDTPTVAPTESPTPVDTAAFHIGFANRGYGCPLVSQIVERILEERLDTSTALVNFDTVESMFRAVANNEIDMTLCYLDPDDREILRGDNKRTIGFKMVQLGSQYWENGNQKLQMWVNLPTMSELRTTEHTCMLNFFYSLRFVESDLQTIDVDDWLDTHAADIDGWVNCES